MSDSGSGSRLPWAAADPYSFYATRRTEGPVVWDERAGAWLVLGYAEARQVLAGPGWTSDPLAAPGVRDAADPLAVEFTGRTMLFADGATHRRLRGSLRDVFAPGFIAGLTDGIDAVLDDLLDSLPAGAEVDFAADVALPLPLAVIGAWLDLDDGATAALQELSPSVIRALGAFADGAEIAAGAAAAAALTGMFLPLAADRRAHPGDDLLSYLATDPDLELDDVVANALLLAVAGHETTANVLGAGIVRLLSSAAPVPAGPPSGRSDARLVAELLRLDAPAQAVARTAEEEHEIAGVTIAAGDAVLVVIAAANRDPAVFVEPDTLLPEREGPPTLSFGHGAHFCLGAALARLELEHALPRVLARAPRLSGPVAWRDTPAVRGPVSVPVVFDR
ncbi:cytochrome P450 [Tsukamurella sp. 8F]|uniref:cytochrome P450 n=1 Tax=unclassified Tsukamurella TaxID=2633480 RepID=UPI0023B9FA54|nr:MULTISPECIES: cytochrome P450 [unclassified Tsukamurella]MDF0529062.1 cytochrome P450 [Tsukamurella sp. 8J]MDF0587436.1 cytochrome P450 [Tsukamurella sp. 8F]